MELWNQMIQHSIIGGLAILLVIIFSATVKKSFRYKYKKYAWFLVSLWLLLPFPIDGGSKKIIIQVPQIYINKIENEIQDSGEHKEIYRATLYKGIKENRNNNEPLINSLLFWIWICGEIILLLYFGIGYILTHIYTVRQSTKCDSEEFISVLKSVAATYKMKRLPQLYLLKDKKSGPFTVGLFKKKILLPNREYIQKDLQYILSHEIVHCKENDTGIKLLVTIGNIVHWFNPFVWLMVKNVAQDIELCCDEIVLEKRSLNERKEYGEIIMSCIQPDMTKKYSYSSGYVNNTKFMKKRFQNIFNTKNKKQGFIFCICLMGFLIIGSGCIGLEQKIFTPFSDELTIDSGFEIRTDVNGDGEQDRVFVKDNVSGDHAFTQLATELNGKKDNVIFTDFEGYWSSYIVSGDLSGNGIADIVVMRESTGSTFGGGVATVLHFENNKWIEYPSVFIQNQEIGISQPENFYEDNLDVSCLGATMIEGVGGAKLRLILNEDITNDTVKCVDCSYQGDGWYIEKVEIITNYYENEKDKELLNTN